MIQVCIRMLVWSPEIPASAGSWKARPVVWTPVLSLPYDKESQRCEPFFRPRF